MTLQVYGIPNCGTCKKALAWLDAKQIPYEFINTKDHPPSQADITAWVQTLGNKPLRNTSGQSYRSLGTTKDSWGDGEWITAFAQDAMLLKRPLFVQDGTAVAVGFRNPDAIAQQLAIG
ncbi:Spx/MgsR family RNA polymerase-binding regulatory protein [Alkalinema sp. FACHB-956]|uniref:Spx/MgsR family RNA polymerase-binding regulatory protein n=1 Tax=Alkalinema sp. FACHB-956 TaxID=2692768 RepID=UPI0016860AC0|nr:Spx/MgsR family RNA polymerase-binding regulatory protein [Alkalinema sp. FACHB-956]MBD2326734.1 Spx/MgsR family RNA polymerase-binding regulatory protein [Alkalinema sp. FACHB-956]